MYHYNSRISYSMLDLNGNLNIPSIVNYFQDVCLFHSHDVGVSIDSIINRHAAWLLSSWHLIFKRFPNMGEHVVVRTSPYEFKGIYGFRSFLLETEDGEKLAYADSTWFLFDSIKGRPIRPSEEEINRYGKGNRYNMKKTQRKVKIPQDETFVEKLFIYQNQIDTNNHVNNGEYVRIACNYIPNDIKCSELRVEYKKAAYLGDAINVYTSETLDCFYVILRNEDGEIYISSEFTKG